MRRATIPVFVTEATYRKLLAIAEANDDMPISRVLEVP